MSTQPKFAVGERVIVLHEDSAPFVAEIIARRFSDSWTNRATGKPHPSTWGYWVDPDPVAGPGDAYSEDSLRKLPPPADDSFSAMMEKLKGGVEA